MSFFSLFSLKMSALVFATSEERQVMRDDLQTHFNSTKVRHDEFGCILWQGVKDGSYPTRKVVIGGRKITVRSHQVSYFVFTDDSYRGLDFHVSHLCHRKNCLNRDHLTQEHCSINHERSNCNKAKVCSGHPGHGPCILH